MVLQNLTTIAVGALSDVTTGGWLAGGNILVVGRFNGTGGVNDDLIALFDLDRLTRAFLDDVICCLVASDALREGPTSRQCLPPRTKEGTR